MSDATEQLSRIIEEIVEEKVAAILGERQPAEEEPPSENPEKELTPAQVAEELNVHPGTLKRWRREKAGPEYKKLSARTIRYRLGDVLEFKKQRERK